MSSTPLLRVPVFPLAGALLFPRTRLPLHIFEPRYREMVRDAMQGDRLIAMIQPRDSREPPGLFAIGCLGHIADCEPLEDGRFNIELEGVGRFRVAREARGRDQLRQVEVDRGAFVDAEDEEPLALGAAR
jgi:Lon protease-like protein